MIGRLLARIIGHTVLTLCFISAIDETDLCHDAFHINLRGSLAFGLFRR